MIKEGIEQFDFKNSYKLYGIIYRFLVAKRDKEDKKKDSGSS
jgi:hypothetical protein